MYHSIGHCTCLRLMLKAVIRSTLDNEEGRRGVETEVTQTTGLLGLREVREFVFKPCDDVPDEDEDDEDENDDR